MTEVTETHPVRVYYEDTDHGGVVYYANYLKFMERGRSEFLRTAGLELDAIEDEYGVLFAVTEAHVFYHSPALFNDLLSVESALVEMRGVRITFKQSIYRQSDKTLLCEGNIRLACIMNDGKVGRIPVSVKNKLRAYLT